MGPVADQEVLPPGLAAHPDLEVKPTGSTRPHIKVLQRDEGRVVLECKCGAAHAISYNNVMAAMMVKLLAKPLERRVDILTFEL
jgi:hypothetical protein